MRLGSTFGMFEMEQAAEKFVDAYNQTGSGIIPIDLFVGDRSGLVGFSELIAHGWICPYIGQANQAGQEPRGLWKPTLEFWERIRKHHPEELKD